MIKYHPYFTGKIYTLRSQEKEKKLRQFRWKT